MEVSGRLQSVAQPLSTRAHPLPARCPARPASKAQPHARTALHSLEGPDGEREVALASAELGGLLGQVGRCGAWAADRPCGVSSGGVSGLLWRIAPGQHAPPAGHRSPAAKLATQHPARQAAYRCALAAACTSRRGRGRRRRCRAQSHTPRGSCSWSCMQPTATSKRSREGVGRATSACGSKCGPALVHTGAPERHAVAPVAAPRLKWMARLEGLGLGQELWAQKRRSVTFIEARACQT